MHGFAVLAGFAITALLPLTAIADEQHIVAQPDSITWTAAPPALPKGAQIAVLSGDPSKEGQFVYRLKVPAGYKVAAHTHPNDENVTVMSGSAHIGMGDKLDRDEGRGAQGRRLYPYAQRHAPLRLVRRRYDHTIERAWAERHHLHQSG